MLIAPARAVLALLARLFVRVCWFAFRRSIAWFRWWFRWSFRSLRHLVLGFVMAGFVVFGIALLVDAIKSALVASVRALPHVLGALPGGAGGALLHALPVSLKVALVALLVVAVVLQVVRAVATRRTLNSRVSYAVLPGGDFDPSLAAVQAFASHLVAMRRRRLAWIDRRACAFRVRLTTTGDGRPLMMWEFPARFKSLLPTVASAYPAVDLVPLEELEAPPPAPLTGPSHVVRLELVPAKELVPLQDMPYPSGDRGVDPLQSFGAALRQVYPHRGDRLEVAIDLRGLGGREADRARSHMFDQARDKDPKGKDQRTAETLERRLRREGLWQRVGPAIPLFQIQILVWSQAACVRPSRWRFLRVRGCCAGHDRAKGMAQRAHACWGQWSGHNYLRAWGVSLFGTIQLGAGLPVVRAWFDLRLKRGLI